MGKGSLRAFPIEKRNKLMDEKTCTYMKNRINQFFIEFIAKSEVDFSDNYSIGFHNGIKYTWGELSDFLEKF